MRSLIGKASEDVAGKPEQEAAVKTFRDEVESMSPAEAYATLGNDAGEVPLPVNRHETYNLLLLLRERAGGYDVLLSNHLPLRPSPLSDWNTMLLPAFKDVRALLEHLRDDVMRQVQERAEDFERAAHAQAFEQAIEQDPRRRRRTRRRPLGRRDTRGRHAEDPQDLANDWSRDRVRLPLRHPVAADQPRHRKAGRRGHSSEEGRRRLCRQGPDHRVAQRPRHGGSARRRAGRPSRALSLGALEAGGCGLRWDPKAGLSTDAGAERRRRAQRAAPGAICVSALKASKGTRSGASAPRWSRATPT